MNCIIGNGSDVAPHLHSICKWHEYSINTGREAIWLILVQVMSLQTSGVKCSVVCHRCHCRGYQSNENATGSKSPPNDEDDLFIG